MQYMSAHETALKWDISQRRVAILCSENRIEGVVMVGNMWLIPKTAVKPADGRTLRYSKNRKIAVKPFIKWAGGKSQLLSDIRNEYPLELGSKINKYAEPFAGGGAVLFDILSKYELGELYIGDINPDLINVYNVIKSSVYELIELLKQYESEYMPMDTEHRKVYYYEKRDRFNELKKQSVELNTEKAAIFIFLNKTCFNGLYRVNKKGLFNVPMGAYKNPCICDEENLLNVSSVLSHVNIHCGSYLDSESFIDENTLVYLDPPYRPLTETSSFTSYTEFQFGDEEQIELAKFANRMKNKNAKVIVSNSDPKNTNENDDFFDNLYSEFSVNRVKATRMINSKSSSRGKISELLIVN